MNEILYSDEIIEIHQDGIILRNLFPVLWNPKIKFSEIQYIKILKPDAWNGKYRISGTGDFRNWFNVDNRRPKRDKIFLLYREKKWWRFGFTCEKSDEVISLLIDKVKLVNKNLEKYETDV